MVDGSPSMVDGSSSQMDGSPSRVDGSLSQVAGSPSVADGGCGLSETGRRAMAGLLATAREMTLWYAPNVNSYKRYQPGSFAPTAIRWGQDNRTCALRLVGHTPTGTRVENRVPGGDVNPYLALAAMVAGAVHGIERELPLEAEFTGNAYDDAAAPRVPANLRDALALWESSAVAREAFGDEVVAHYANNARVELAAFDAAVTDWELRRGFERL
jgi:glutamine synthetase